MNASIKLAKSNGEYFSNTNKDDLVIIATSNQTINISPITSNGVSILQVKKTGIEVGGNIITSNIETNNANIGNIIINNNKLSNIDNLYTNTISFKNNNIITYNDTLDTLMFGSANNLNTIGSSDILYAACNLADIGNIQHTLSNIGLGSNNDVFFANVNVSGKVSTDMLQLSTQIIKYDNTSNNIMFGPSNNLKPLDYAFTGVSSNEITFTDGTIITTTMWNNIVDYLFTIVPIESIVVSNITTSSALISWSGGIYSKIKISWSGGSTGTTDYISFGSSYTATGLISNQNYTFVITPYDSKNTAGTGLTSTITTL